MHLPHTHAHACSHPHSENIGVDISERDTQDHPDGISYELCGESCIPGIDASAWGSIFEEHMVSPCLDPGEGVMVQSVLAVLAWVCGSAVHLRRLQLVFDVILWRGPAKRSWYL